MCRHCERIKEDVESKPIIHAFFEDMAKKINRKAQESNIPLGRPVNANDLSIEVTVNCTVIPTTPLEHVTVVLKALEEMDK